MGQELPPVAVCTKCGKFTNDAGAINQRCYVQRGGKRCDGVFGSTMNNTDWEECCHCAGTGDERGNECPSCQGTGWGYIRDGHRY